MAFFFFVWPAFENAAVRKTAGRACRALYDESMHERCASHLTKPLGDKWFSLKELHDAGKLLFVQGLHSQPHSDGEGAVERGF